MKKKRENKNKINKILIIILVVTAAILLITSLILIIVKSSKSSAVEKKLNKINQLVINGSSKESLSKYMNVDKIDGNYLMTGPDCYMREKPNDQAIKDNKLDTYVKQQNKYASNVEKKIKENFQFIMNDNTFKDNGAKVYTGVVRGYYQLEYMLDLKEIQKQLIEKLNVEDEEINQYKAKVIGMKILNNYLSIYENKDNYSGINIYVYEDKDMTDSSIASYLNMLQGVNYSNKEVVELEETREQRIKEYIDKEIKNNNLKSLDL